MKLAKPKSFRKITLARVKNRQECVIEGLKVMKVRPKTVMTASGDLIVLPDHTMVTVKV